MVAYQFSIQITSRDMTAVEILLYQFVIDFSVSFILVES